MLSSTNLENIATALAIAQAEVSSAQKSGENKFDHYRYAKYEDIAKAAKPVLAAHGLSVLFTAEDLIPLEERVVGQNKDKVEHVVRIKVSARLLHKSGEWMESSAWGEGQDRADKAPYKAMTGAKKYLLAGLLAIPTTDDPESDESVGGAGDHQRTQRNDRGQGSKPSTQVTHQGNGQAPRGNASPAASTSTKAGPSAATSPSPSPSTSTRSTTTAPAEPTQADLRGSQQRAAEARELLDNAGKLFPPNDNDDVYKARSEEHFNVLKKLDPMLASALWKATVDGTRKQRAEILGLVAEACVFAIKAWGEDAGHDHIEFIKLEAGWPSLQVTAFLEQCRKTLKSPAAAAAQR